MKEHLRVHCIVSKGKIPNYSIVLIHSVYTSELEAETVIVPLTLD